MNINIFKIPYSTKQEIITECHKRLNNIGKMTLENISKTDETTRQFLRNNSPARLKELAMMNCFATNKIKTELDTKYGKGNYALIAVGRSISSFAELMQNLGVDVKIIPLSGLRRDSIDNIPDKALNTYKTFLEQIGLSKTDLNNNKDKTYILMDYAYYGRSLKKAEKLLKKEEMLGDADNLISMSVNKALGDNYEKLGFYRLLQYCRFKDYSYVGRLNIDRLQDVYKQCSPDRIKELKGNVTQGLRKLFWFNVFDLYLEKNYEKVFPKKELDAIHKHHMSEKATKGLLKRIKDNNKKVLISIFLSIFKKQKQ